MRNFCESLREHSVKISNFENKKMIPLTNKEYKSYLNQTNGHLCKKKKKSKINTRMTKIIANLKTLAITKVNTEVLQITYVSSKVVYLKKFLCFFLMNWTMIIIFLL